MYTPTPSRLRSGRKLTANPQHFLLEDEKYFVETFSEVPLEVQQALRQTLRYTDPSFVRARVTNDGFTILLLNDALYIWPLQPTRGFQLARPIQITPASDPHAAERVLVNNDAMGLTTLIVSQTGRVDFYRPSRSEPVQETLQIPLNEHEKCTAAAQAVGPSSTCGGSVVGSESGGSRRWLSRSPSGGMRGRELLQVLGQERPVPCWSPGMDGCKVFAQLWILWSCFWRWAFMVLAACTPCRLRDFWLYCFNSDAVQLHLP